MNIADARTRAALPWSMDAIRYSDIDVREHFPYRMALKMFLKPLELPPVMGRVILSCASAATRMLLR